MWEQRTLSWCTWCAQQWGHKKLCRSSPREPVPQHPYESMRQADSDPHANHAFSPKQSGQRHSSAPQLRCSALRLVYTKPWLYSMSQQLDIVQPRVLSSARSTQDQDSALLYTLLTLGLPLGFPWIEEGVLTNITHTHVYILVSQEKITAERTCSGFKVCANECPSPATSQQHQWFWSQLSAFCAKLKLLHAVPSERSLQESFYGLAGCQTGW